MPAQKKIMPSYLLSCLILHFKNKCCRFIANEIAIVLVNVGAWLVSLLEQLLLPVI